MCVCVCVCVCVFFVSLPQTSHNPNFRDHSMIHCFDKTNISNDYENIGERHYLGRM